MDNKRFLILMAILLALMLSIVILSYGGEIEYETEQVWQPESYCGWHHI